VNASICKGIDMIHRIVSEIGWRSEIWTGWKEIKSVKITDKKTAIQNRNNSI
jgi:hypothetical protein